MLLTNVSADEWRRAVVTDNLLQVRSPVAAVKIASVLRSRLHLMKPSHWKMVYEGSHELATQACFAATVKQSRLVGDYLDLVVRERYRLFARTLAATDWANYIEECRGRDPSMPEWSESTVRALRAVVHGMLVQVGYVDGWRTLRLQSVHIAQELLQYLREEDEQYVMRCITVRP